MTNIIAGYLKQQDQVQDVIGELIAAGFAKEKISSFYVNPAGQHDILPFGGDQDTSPGAQESAEGLAAGMATGGAIGAAIGVIGIPLGGPVGPALGALVGAHIGSLAGSMASMKENGESEVDADGEKSDANLMPQRKSGMMVAVCVPTPALEAEAVRILRAQGGTLIERADGTIAGSNWIDFNPLTPPVSI